MNSEPFAADAVQTVSLLPPEGSPFHAGEIAVQQRAGVEQVADMAGRRSIRREMPEQHRAFFETLPLMVFGGTDDTGQPWATLRVGLPGFVSSPDPQTLRITGGELPGDPLLGQWRIGAMMGGLGIQAETRRRNRVNGVITSIDHDNDGEFEEAAGVAGANGATCASITLHVQQSFGNCPKYIQSRAPVWRTQTNHSRGMQPSTSRNSLDASDRALIAQADTFFIATSYLADDAAMARGADVSHRGGLPGFVRIDNDTTLTTPDFAGNRFFNTLGNLLVEPRAGLLFIDYTSGDLLYLAVRAEIIWHGAEHDTEIAAFPLAQRLVRFHITDVRRSDGVLPLQWSDAEYARELTRDLVRDESVNEPVNARGRGRSPATTQNTFGQPQERPQ